MKKSIYSLFFIFSISFSNAQVWCPPGAEWSYSYIEGAWGCDGLHRYKYIGDTIINSVSCKNIQQTKSWKCPWETEYTTVIFANHYLYADIDKVYYFKNNQFNVLYDFSVQIGDTLEVLSHAVYPGCDSIAKLEVDSVGIMVLNSQTLRYYSVHGINNSPYTMNCRIVEKVGPFYNYLSNGMNYFFPVKNDICGVAMDETPEYGIFKCYRDDNFSTVSLSPDSCSFTLDIAKVSDYNFSLYPNPVLDKLGFLFESNNSKEITIYNCFGDILFTRKVNGFNHEMEIDFITPGIYFIEIYDENKFRSVKKIIKIE